MALTALYAQLCCRDLGQSRAWFEALFGRAADAEPMEGLAEWHHGTAAGLQLFQEPAKAGHGSLTMIVSDLEAERARLSESPVALASVTQGDAVRFMQVADPDGNRVVLVEPRSVLDG